MRTGNSGQPMDLAQRLGQMLPGSTGSRQEEQYECNRCGETYETPSTPCEECGSDVMVPVE